MAETAQKHKTNPNVKEFLNINSHLYIGITDMVIYRTPQAELGFHFSSPKKHVTVKSRIMTVPGT